MGRIGNVMFLIVLAGGLTAKGAQMVDYRGYKDCIKLSNGTTDVIVVPQCGARVLAYTHEGRNVLYENPAQDGILWQPGKEFDPDGGRFDIGSEFIVPRHENLWIGPWKGEITGKYSARCTSVEDPASGVQLVRDFRLDPRSSRLVCTQTMRNCSKKTTHWFYWSRTLAKGGGTVIVPLNPNSRFPQGFMMYGPGSVLNYRPGKLKNIETRDGYFIINGAPEIPKYGLDSEAGWIAYANDGILFVKRFPVWPERVYSDTASFTVELFCREHLCELEPVGPREILRPGQSASFTEAWYLFPWSKTPVEPGEVEAFVRKNTRAVSGRRP